MIDQVTFQNYKCLKNVICTLSQLTVIVGPNGSGKSSILEGLHDLSQLASDHCVDSIDYLFNGPRWFESLHSGDGADPMVLSCKRNGATFDFRVSTKQSTVDRMALGDSGWFGGAVGKVDNSTYVSTDPSKDGNEAALGVKSLVLLRLEASQLAKTSYSNSEIPKLESSGQGLASVIANLKMSEPEIFDSLLAMLRRIVPQIRQIRIRKRKLRRFEKEVVSFRDKSMKTTVPRTFIGDLLVFDFENRKDVPATNVSEGTMLVLGLLAMLHSPSRPKIILLDDIEKGLHPDAQRELVVMLREILAMQSDLQIVATSHSPYFLDFLKFEEVRVMTLSEDGYSICGRLESHAKFEKWKEELAPGEMWSLFGEKWLSEGAK